jgi:hypothetical protein
MTADLNNAIVTDFNPREWNALTKKQRVAVLAQTPADVVKSWSEGEASRIAQKYGPVQTGNQIIDAVNHYQYWYAVWSIVTVVFALLVGGGVWIGVHAGWMNDPEPYIQQAADYKQAHQGQHVMTTEELNQQQNDEFNRQREARIAAAQGNQQQ